MRQARVLLLVKGLGRGGTEQLLVSSLRYFDRSRFDIHVGYVLPWKDALVERARAAGVPVHCLGAGSQGRYAWPLRLRRLVKTEAFDIVHSHMPVPAVAARVLLPRRPPAIIHTEHNLADRYRRLTWWSNVATYTRNSAVFAVSDAVAQSIRLPRAVAGHSPLIEVLVHGIDPDRIEGGPAARAAARRALGLDPGCAVIGHVGNFTPKKDQRSLLAAMAMLSRSFSDLRLVVVGTGPLEGVLQSRAAELGIGDRVMWAGSRDDVLQLLPGFDVFVLSSLYEGLPIALLEAMATGVACVVTAVGGSTEVIDHGVTGLLVPPGDPAELAAAVRGLLDNPAYREEVGRNAAVRGREYDLGRAVRRMEDQYTAALHPQPTGLGAKARSTRRA